MKGTVKWFNNMKNFGFIEIDEGKDVFVHQNALPVGVVLYEGDNVEFETEDTEKGPQAINVKKIE
jgi:CspA family cold shock protein